MLCELEVNNIGTYVELITRIDAEQQYRMWFRGQSDYSWGLVPSVQRKDGMGEHYEQYITTNFMIHTMRLNPSVPQRYDRASWLTLMQHYGLPTRLLDWSESPLVALYFALSSDEDAKADAAVWVLNPMKLNKKVGYGEYVPPINYDSLSSDLEGAFSNHDNDNNESQNRIIACHGVGSDLRMYVQQSDFTIHSTSEHLDKILMADESCDYFYKIRIPQQIRKQLLVQLDAMGFHESSIYPDMEHTIRPTNSIYRAVNYLKMGTVTPGFDRIVAGTIGTPPAKFVKNNRFSEEGDMMFYGACNQTILKREVTKTKNPYTIGTFHTNKRINVLNFSGIQLWKKPSIFDLENKETRDSWFFLDSFIRMISKDIQSSQSEKEYKPTQVFTKFIQRYTKYYGIEYRSSKSDATDNNKAVVRDRCYVLFATNRDCIDECERAVKLDQKRLQMIMETYVQV